MSRSTNIILVVIGVVIILAVSITLARRNKSADSTTTATTSSTPLESTNLATATPASDLAAASPSTDVATPSPTSVTVSYTSSGFSPNNLTIATGTTVTFINNSNGSMWVASDPHPAHTDFSAFDARKGYAKGQSYSFTFSKAGTYGFHNHLRDDDTGTITVQ